MSRFRLPRISQRKHDMSTVAPAVAASGRVGRQQPDTYRFEFKYDFEFGSIIDFVQRLIKIRAFLLYI